MSITLCAEESPVRGKRRKIDDGGPDGGENQIA